MSRQSAAAMAMAVIGPTGIETVARAAPPETLTEEQREIWLTIVNRMPANWFPAETHCLLEQYCRHVTRARRVAQLLAALEASREFEPSDYQKLLHEEARQTTTIAMLAMKMRLAQQALDDGNEQQ